MGFSNDVRESAGNFRITLFGYNYDELYEWAEKLKEKLLSYRRIREVSINSEYSWWKDDYQEFNFNLDIRRLAEENILPIQLYESLSPVFTQNLYAGTIVIENELEKLKLMSVQSREYDLWNMQHIPQYIQGIPYKIAGLATIEK